jgi:predicted DsbA family dithiol-disulfide isomerase
MPVIDVGIRSGDHRGLKQIAERVGLSAKEVAGILLEQAIRRETGIRLVTSDQTPPRGPEAA